MCFVRYGWTPIGKVEEGWRRLGDSCVAGWITRAATLTTIESTGAWSKIDSAGNEMI